MLQQLQIQCSAVGQYATLNWHYFTPICNAIQGSSGFSWCLVMLPADLVGLVCVIVLLFSNMLVVTTVVSRHVGVSEQLELVEKASVTT